MLTKRLIFTWLSTIVLKVTSTPENNLDRFLDESHFKPGSNNVEKRQAPWLPPQPFQSFGNPLFYPNTREGWRYPPCSPYPPYPQYTPSPPYPPASSTSSSDDPNDILNRMGGGNGQQLPKKEPSRCVWAVVACCSPGSRDIRYSCFELLGCPGAFWDVNPCEDKVVMTAANSALTFYSDKNNGTTNSTSS